MGFTLPTFTSRGGTTLWVMSHPKFVGDLASAVRYYNVGCEWEDPLNNHIIISVVINDVFLVFSGWC